MVVNVWLLITDYSESLGSEEESGKDWDELEEEARKGEIIHIHLKRCGFPPKQCHFLEVWRIKARQHK